MTPLPSRFTFSTKRSKFLENWVPSAKAETARRVISLAETTDPGNTAASMAAAARPTMRMISPLYGPGYRRVSAFAYSCRYVRTSQFPPFPTRTGLPGGWNETDTLRHDHGRRAGVGGCPRRAGRRPGGREEEPDARGRGQGPALLSAADAGRAARLLQGAGPRRHHQRFLRRRPVAAGADRRVRRRGHWRLRAQHPHA